MISVNLLKGIFLVGKVINILAVGWDSPPPPNPQGSQGSNVGGKVHTWGRQQSNIKEGDIFGKNGNTGCIFLGDNPAGHCFVLRDLVPTSFLK